MGKIARFREFLILNDNSSKIKIIYFLFSFLIIDGNICRISSSVDVLNGSILLHFLFFSFAEVRNGAHSSFLIYQCACSSKRKPMFKFLFYNKSPFFYETEAYCLIYFFAVRMKFETEV